MIIHRPGKKPLPGGDWWREARLVCLTCDCEFSVEAADVQSRAVVVMTTPINILAKCPVCDDRVSWPSLAVREANQQLMGRAATLD